jgi:hypothetical protein
MVRVGKKEGKWREVGRPFVGRHRRQERQTAAGEEAQPANAARCRHAGAADPRAQGRATEKGRAAGRIPSLRAQQTHRQSPAQRRSGAPPCSCSAVSPLPGWEVLARLAGLSRAVPAPSCASARAPAPGPTRGATPIPAAGPRAEPDAGLARRAGPGAERGANRRRRRDRAAGSRPQGPRALMDGNAGRAAAAAADGAPF